MINLLKIRRIELPPHFLFDQLRLSARFVSTSVQLASLTFNAADSMMKRTVPVNVQLKVPALRSRFVLRLQVEIINLEVPWVQIPVDLGALQGWSRLQYVFLTELGRVSVHLNIIEEIYLPKQEIIECDDIRMRTQQNRREVQSLGSSFVEKEKISKINQNGITKSMKNNVESQKQSNNSKDQNGKKMLVSRSQYLKLDLKQSWQSIQKSKSSIHLQNQSQN